MAAAMQNGFNVLVWLAGQSRIVGSGALLCVDVALPVLPTAVMVTLARGGAPVWPAGAPLCSRMGLGGRLDGNPVVTMAPGRTLVDRQPAGI